MLAGCLPEVKWLGPETGHTIYVIDIPLSRMSIMQFLAP